MLIRKNTEFRLHPLFIIGLIVFSMGGILSSFRSKIPVESFLAVIKYFYLIGIWFWLGTVILRNEKHIYTAILVWILSAAITSAGAIAQLIWGDIIPGTSHAAGRMTGLTEHVNDLGGVACVALMPALMLASQEDVWNWKKSLLYFLMFLIAAGLILSVSISGLIAAFSSFFLWWIISRAKMKNVVMFIVMCVVSILTLSFSIKHGGISIVDRLTDVAEKRIYFETSASRIDAYSLAWKSISRNPLVGVGVGPYVGITDAGYTVHNFILLNWYESGVLGFIGIVLILILLINISIYIIRTSESESQRSLSVSLFSSYTAFLVLGMAQPIYFKRFGWISAALIMALYVLHKKSLLANCSCIMSTEKNVIPS